MAEDMDSVVSNIRALIVSSKHPIAIRNLSMDYETIIGNPIPYRSFKFHTLESFLQNIPTLKVTGSGRDLMVEAVKDQASSHISQMISKQKTSKKHPPHARRGGHSQRGGISRSSYMSRQSSQNRYTTYPSSSHQSYSKKEYSASSNQTEHKPKLLVVASKDTRQVSLEAKEAKVSLDAAKHLHSQKEAKATYVVPPRFQKSRQRSSKNISYEHVASMDYITKDVEDKLFLDKYTECDPRLREIDTDIISPLTPSQLVAVGRAKQEFENSNNTKPCLTIQVNRKGIRSCFFWK